MFARSRYARSRVMQIAAWLLTLFCVSVTVTGVVVGKTATSIAQDAPEQEATQQTAPPTEPVFKRQVGQGDSSGIGSRAISFLGIFALIGLAVLMSNNRKKIN